MIPIPAPSPQLTHSLSMLTWYSVVIGITPSVGGVLISSYWDIPSGSAIVLFATWYCAVLFSQMHITSSYPRPREPRPAMAAPDIVVANALRRQFVATRPNQKWAGDITYVSTRQGWLYVAVLMDLFSRPLSSGPWMIRRPRP